MQRVAARMGQWPHDTMDVWTNEAGGLGACVLHTTAESFEANQPWLSEDRAIGLVLDGYLTNWEDLRRDLAGRGVRLRNRSDAELVLRAYEKWGEECAQRIEGEFAFVVIDLRQRKAFCARDHQGLRPLYYAMVGDTFIAASSIALVLEGLGFDPEANLEFLAEVAAGEVVTVDQTGWKGVLRLKPAHSLAVSQAGLQTRQYYVLPDPVIRHWKDDSAYIEEYRAVLEETVRRTSRSHAPLAYEVSGGLDSSAVFCMADQLEKQAKLLAPSLAGYTLRGEAGSDSDEIEYARAAASHVGRDLVEEGLFRPDLDWFNAEFGRYRDMPGYTNTVQSMLLEQRMVEDGARVAINGAGGDQWLDGTLAYYDQYLNALAFDRLIEAVRRDLPRYGIGRVGAWLVRKSVLAFLPDRLRANIKGLKRSSSRLYIHDFQYLLPEWVEKVQQAHRNYREGLPAGEMAQINRRKFDGVGNQRAYDLMYRQRAVQGLEGRSPMLTRQFIEFCSSLPEDIKLRGGRTKWIHREAMRGSMPASIVDRDTKAFFPERKHDAAIRAFIDGAGGDALSALIDRDKFAAFAAFRVGHDVDDEWGWPYWGAYMVAAFLIHTR